MPTVDDLRSTRSARIAAAGQRAAFFAAGAGAAVLGAGYFLQQPWALATWPWSEGRLSNVFVSSILAAIAVPLWWIAARAQFGAAAGGFVHLAVMLGGAAGVFATVAGARAHAVGAALGAACCLALAAWSHRLPVRDRRPLPRALRWWFVAYVLILLPAGIALTREVPGIMPWPLKPQTSLLYGWVFLAAICSFAYPLWRPQVAYARVGLWGFLAYDAVLLPPLLLHSRGVKPEFALTLAVYSGVLALTAVVSVWYLFISRETRLAAATGAA